MCILIDLDNKEKTYIVLEYLEHDFQYLMRTLKFDQRQMKCVML